MKLSVTYNFFNGEEFLYNSIKNLRPVVDHISIIYQDISNFNNKISQEALSVIEKLRKEKLVDDFFLYTPNFEITPQENEYLKRKKGYDLAKDNNATHILLCDADEFYEQKEFIKAKKKIEDDNISFSACHSYFYIHKPTYRSKEFDSTNVCFICRLDSYTEFLNNITFPVDNVDPTRRIINKDNNFYFFDDEIVMHHMNFVRPNFNSKLLNSTSNSNPRLREFLKEVKKSLNNWKFGNEFYFPNKGKYQIIEVENTFGLQVEFNRKSNIFKTVLDYVKNISS